MQSWAPWAHGAHGLGPRPLAIAVGPGPGTRAPSHRGETLTKKCIFIMFLLIFDDPKKTRTALTINFPPESRRDLFSEIKS